MTGTQENIAIVTLEMQFQELREQRNQLLRESDWTQLPDVPESIKSKWLPYRQQLRDITNSYSNVKEVEWPIKPL